MSSDQTPCSPHPWGQPAKALKEFHPSSWLVKAERDPPHREAEAVVRQGARK